MNSVKIEHNLIDFPGGKISYYAGRGAGPMPIVFIHGAAGDSRIFSSQLRFFSPEFTSVAIDLPGHGKSIFDSPVSMDMYISAVREVIRSEGFNEVILVGHSMGGALCMQIAAEKIIPLAALVLVSTGIVLPVSDKLRSMIDNDVELFIDTLVGMTFTKKSEFIANLVKRGIDSRMLSIIKNDLEICSRLNLAGIVEKIDIPSLVIANSEDMVLPSDITKSLYGKIKNSRYIEFAAAGHVPFFEEKALFNAALAHFILEIT